MRKAVFAVLLAVSAFVAAWSQPKVAVLDAIIPQNMDPSVIVPATDKIIEKLVQSNRFTVLDRTNIESVLKEREFQVSGMVSDQDAVAAGKYLEADFIVIAKVSKVGDTFFISGKMINVKTGVIVSTTSAQGDGQLAVLIGLAGQVGEVLAGGSTSPSSVASKDVVVTPPPEQVVTPPPEPEPAREPLPPHNLTQSFIGIGGLLNRATWEWSGDYSNTSYYDKEKYSLDTLQLEIIPSKYLQVGIGFTWFSSATEDYKTTKSSGSGDLYNDYTMTWLDINFLFRLPIQLGHTPVALVPMAGFEFDINMSYEDADGNDLTSSMSDKEKADLNHFYFQVGAGVQIDLGDVVLYPEFLYCFKIHSELDDDYESLSGYSSQSVTTRRMDFGLIVGYKI